MSRSHIRDQEVRELISTKLNSTIFVDAGAGTGKTAALVSRYVSLIESGRAQVREIAAITFTEKAAAELRERVRRELKTRRSDCTEPNSRSLLGAAIEQLDEAQISTIHSFAQSILLAYPLEAGLPPSFVVEDEIAAEVEFSRRWDDFWNELLDDRDLWDALKYGFLLGLKPSSLVEVAREFEENWDRLDSVGFEEIDSFSVDVSPVIDAIDNCLESLPENLPDGDKMTDRIGAIVELRDYLALLDGDDAIVRLGSARIGRDKVGRAPLWKRVGADIEEVRAAVLEVEEARLRFLERVKAYVTTTLGKRLVRFAIEGAEERAREGRLRFHDLLVHCRRLLAQVPGVREAVRGRVRFLLIDEFQDTDPLQLEIALLIGSDPTRSGTGPFPAPDEGRVFFVGDPKQSIYRFRGADVLLYQRAKSELGGEVLELTSNFRSSQKILSCVGEVFEELLVEDDRLGQVGYVPLDFAKGREVGEARVMVVGGPIEASASKTRVSEFESLAGVIQCAVGNWQVLAADGVERPARYSDVAVLIRGRTGLGQLESSLTSAGIPYRLEARELIYASQEARDLIAVLRAVADPSDQIGIVAALKSALFACSDRDLLEYATAVGDHVSVWDYTQVQTQVNGGAKLVAEALGKLREYSELHKSMTPSALLEHIVRDRVALEISGVLDRARDRWRRLRLVADECRAFLDGGGESLSDFLSWVDDVSSHGGRGETLLPDPDDDAVRVLTIHAAKGLEFPIAVVAGIGAKPPSIRQRLYWGAGGKAEIQMGRKELGFGTPGLNEARERVKSLNQGEEIRLGYVAMTRARDHLVVSLYHTEGAKDSLAGKIFSKAEKAGLVGDRGEIPPPVRLGSVLTAVPGDSVSAQAARDAWLDERKRILRKAERPSVVSASSLLRAVNGAGEAPLNISAATEESTIRPSLMMRHTGAEEERPRWAAPFMPYYK